MTTVAERDVGALVERAEALRRLNTGPRPLVLPNAWDAASARLVVKAGFPVVATSSGAIAATLGYDDNDSIPGDEAIGVVARIARSVPVPVTADLEAGYRLSPKELVERLPKAGAVGCNLEDTDHDGDTDLLDAGENAERLRAVRHAATEAGVEIVLFGGFVPRDEGPVNVVGAGAPPPLVRLAGLGVARVGFAGFLMN
jgi:2-methylisocitrate lyase-like PEP mutase family enzyme